MGGERGHIGPLLDHHEGVRSKAGLGRGAVRHVHGGAVLDAPGLGQHGGYVGPELLQHGLPLSRLRGDDGNDMNHDALLPVRAGTVPWRGGRG